MYAMLPHTFFRSKMWSDNISQKYFLVKNPLTFFWNLSLLFRSSLVSWSNFVHCFENPLSYTSLKRQRTKEKKPECPCSRKLGIYTVSTWLQPHSWKEPPCNVKSRHIWSESNLVKFWIPNIPKTVLRSPQVAETDGTMGGPQIKNHTFFVLSL